MRIGILTLPFNNNYGGYLQAYALITVLKNMGHDVELINRRRNKTKFNKQITYFIKTLIKILLGRKHGPVFFDEEYYFRQKGKYLMPFVDKHISPKTKPLYSSEELKQDLVDKYDAVIVGSDQVWRPIYVPNIEDYFLDVICDKKVKKIAYAASFGTDTPEYTKVQIEKCGQLIERFDFVSIREKGGIGVFRRFGWKRADVKVVLDPTMLLPSEHYKKYIKANNSRYIATYLLDNNKNKEMICNQVVESLKLKIVPLLQKSSEPMLSIEDWLSIIYNSQFVITDSFHGTVFCLLFNRPFIVVANKERGLDRFKSLLSTFDLVDRICNNTDVDKIINKDIDWRKVNLLLDDFKEKSYSFINEALSVNKVTL